MGITFPECTSSTALPHVVKITKQATCCNVRLLFWFDFVKVRFSMDPVSVPLKQSRSPHAGCAFFHGICWFRFSTYEIPFSQVGYPRMRESRCLMGDMHCVVAFGNTFRNINSYKLHWYFVFGMCCSTKNQQSLNPGLYNRFFQLMSLWGNNECLRQYSNSLNRRRSPCIPLHYSEITDEGGPEDASESPSIWVRVFAETLRR